MPEYIKREEVLAQIEAKQKSIEAEVNCNYRAALSDVHKIVSSIPSSGVIEVSGEIKTNYDRIRNKSVEEMGNFLMDWAMEFMCGKSPLNVFTWLESEVEGE